jgi:hypothetical protein
MSEYILFNYQNLVGSDNNNNSGHSPRKPKYAKTFLNTATGVLHTATDIEILRSKRNKIINQFNDTYERKYQNQEVSILSFIVNESDYSTVSKFLNSVSAKLRRKHVSKLGYYWLRDVGENEFKPHFHVIMATSRITVAEFQSLFLKRKQKYKVEFQKTKSGLKKYLTDKELFGKKGQRTFGRSKTFKKI